MKAFGKLKKHFHLEIKWENILKATKWDRETGGSNFCKENSNHFFA